MTRERIFFNRMSFDLKIASASPATTCTCYEPDVDRDGFDIVVEDQENGIGWFQIKAVLRSAATAKWTTTIGFMRPPHTLGEAFQFAPVECGRGGGVILIEIDDTTANGDVIYSYTDFRILTALAERYLGRIRIKVPGRPRTAAQSAAKAVLKAIRAGKSSDSLEIPGAAFVELKAPDGLLALMALQNSEEFGAFSIHQAYSEQVEIDQKGEGVVSDDRSIQALGNLHWHMEKLSELLGGATTLKPFTWKSSNTIASR